MTMSRYASILLLGSLALAGSLTACQPPGSRSQSPVSSAPPARTGSPELPSEAPRAAQGAIEPAGKPLAPIDFEYALLGEPAIGAPLDIRVTSRVQADLDALNVALSGDERVQVPAAMARFRMTQAARGAPMSRTIRVTPLVAGTLYLDVLLEAEIGGRRQSRAVTIPIRVGGPAEAPEPDGALSTDADGQPIISLPAADR